MTAPIETTYRPALEAAVEAAAAARDILLAETRRPGGPRGNPGHCPADEEAEALIRARLLSAYPSWGYLGEETGARAATSGERHVWVVDPNDGTRNMQRGVRGHAVSIAVLRDGQPILGVVQSVNAPDDDGDTFAWAEGCGPLRRNGQAIAPPAWPAAPERSAVVYLSHAANRNWGPNVLTVAPMRYIATASIAYRLALAAAGEGVAAVSLSGPVSWDFAGGHALIAAAGGALLDRHGQPMRYGPTGHSAGGDCFGGAPAIAEYLAAQPWASVFASVPPGSFEPAATRPGRLCRDSARLRRAQGCLLGQVAGDALGSLVEFQDARPIRARFPDGPRLLADGGTWGTLAGQPTDDSEMAILLARTLALRGNYDADAAAAAYARWYQGWLDDATMLGRQEPWGRPFDVGTTTATALSAIRPNHVRDGGAAAAASAAANGQSQANGSLMRLSPLGVWGADRPPDAVAEAARADARLTHPHLACQECAAVYAVAIAHAVASGADPNGVYAFTRDWATAHCRAPEVLDWLAAAASRPPDDFHRQQGWVRIAFQNAFFRLLHAPTLADGVVATVREGGDTDTNAAIAAALLGAVHGRPAIPLQWRQAVLCCRPAPTYPTAHRPRPAALWPVDVESLAELLLMH